LSDVEQPGAVPEPDPEVRARVELLLAGRGDSVEQRSLVSLLQAVQQDLGFLPREAMRAVAEFLGVSPARVYGVATFYNQFRFTPPGRYQIKVCMGTACAIKLGGVILDSWRRRLEIDVGETTADREYSLDRVACVGCCSMAPVTVVDEDVHGDMSPTKVDGILLQHRMAWDRAEAVTGADADAAGEAE
jgi:NADH-quinone oxidoreductase subunit E